MGFGGPETVSNLNLCGRVSEEMLTRLYFLYSLRAARVLLIGLGGLGAEIAKNLTLSGIKSITLLDHRLAVENSSNFLVSQEKIGKNVSFKFFSK